eukprot:TRINITY_DN6011_c0_g2_i1.p2 TRINITY_DN6011_c0_g2~~TRINITY_DN6011_c0_g2_i1.p2  ORF type:complete len:136 (-),score=31.02 TRINITY_DN6011_c0_g2_i1:344-751(-)
MRNSVLVNRVISLEKRISQMAVVDTLSHAQMVNNKILKAQEKVLKSMRNKLGLVSGEGCYAELVIFLAEHFDLLLKSCLEYLKLFQSLTKTYVEWVDSPPSKVIEHLLKSQEEQRVDSKIKLQLIVNKVLYLTTH